MKQHIALALIGPMLYLQGRRVRQRTPQLPEPQGARIGTTGQGAALRLLIVGDSAAAGVGVADQQQALSGQLVAALAADHTVSWQLLARSGDTSAQLLDALADAPAQAVDVVVVSIGVNDVTALISRRRWRANLRALVGLLEGRFGRPRVVLTPVPPMHRFPALPQPLRWWLGLRAQALNRDMRRLADAHAAVSCVPIDYPADTQFMASDGFHPGARAYALWARHLARAITAPR